MNAEAAQARVRQALELLGRASQDWRNGTAEVPGALHWPVAVRVARDELAAALEAVEQHGKSSFLGASDSAAHCVCGRDNCPGACLDSLGWDCVDARAGIAWWQSLTRTEQRHWLAVAGSGRPVDAWAAFQTEGLRHG